MKRLPITERLQRAARKRPDTLARIGKAITKATPALARRPLKGRGVWRRLSRLFDGVPVEVPSVLAWNTVAHEIAHAWTLGLPRPWNVQAVNDALMALPRRDRIDNEIRAALLQPRIVEGVTGVRIAGPVGTRRLAVDQGAGASIIERRYGADVSQALTFFEALMRGEHRAEVVRLRPAMRRRVARIEAQHNARRDAAAIVRLLESL